METKYRVVYFDPATGEATEAEDWGGPSDPHTLDAHVGQKICWGQDADGNECRAWVTGVRVDGRDVQFTVEVCG